MDANQTRFHLLLGQADWARCTDLQPEPFHVQWDPERCEIILERQLFRFITSKFEKTPSIDQRRGAARDRYGNWYWIDDSELEIRVHSTGSDQTSHFWASGDEMQSARINSGYFTPSEAQLPPAPLKLCGLTVTDDHYLVVGVQDPAGLLIFDLYAGGPPQHLLWPASLPFAPFDMIARPGGGVWILDRANKRYWGLNRNFQVIRLSPPPIASPPHGQTPYYFTGEGPRGSTRPLSLPHEALSLDYAAPLAADNPIAIESLPDSTVIILDSPTHFPTGTVPFSKIWHYKGATLVDSTTTSIFAETLQQSDQDPSKLVGYDFAFVGKYTNSDGLEVPDRLYITASTGGQTFAFDFVSEPEAGLSLRVLDLYLPMRLFGGKALVAAGAQLFFDFRDGWVPLVPQQRQRFALKATLLTPAFDGREPDCVWHRLMLDGCLPPETTLEIWSRTANESSDLPHASWQSEPPLYRRGSGSELPWAPKPKKSAAGTWELLFQRAQGRFLQLQLNLTGDGKSSPHLRALRVYYPRFSYLRNYLPALYREDQESASFLERFLANIEGSFTALEDKIAAVQMLFDLRSAPAETLDWLANWFGVALDPTWDEARRRLFIRYAIDFFRWRGTTRGLVMALRLAFEENPGPSLFTEAGAQSACARRFRIVEKFRTRSTPGVLLGDVGSSDFSAATPTRLQATRRWTPSQGLNALDRRYRDFIGTNDPTVHFTLDASDPRVATPSWISFVSQTLGFVPSQPSGDVVKWRLFLQSRYGNIGALNATHGSTWPAFQAVQLPATRDVRPEVWQDWRDFVSQQGLDGGERLSWWQEFLARRYAGVSNMNSAYGTSWPDFGLIPLPGELSPNLATLTDWFQFEGVVLPIRAAAHRFSALLPATSVEATNSQERLRTLQLASRIVELEKPAHTVFDVRFYWAFFRIGEARLGEDTQLGQGSRAPELLPAAIVDSAFLAESYLAPAPPHDTRERRVLGRDPI